jgi:uncharacterized protein YjiS (DUF1127 family)
MRLGKTLARPQILLDHLPLQGPTMFYDTSRSASDRPRRASFLAIAVQPWQMLANLMLQRQTRTTLSNLSDHNLKDIGISRSDIPYISHNASPARLTRFGR